jgi:hypothetical protein
MNHALAVRHAATRIDGRAVERELHQILELDERGAALARQDEALAIARIAHADVTERIDDAFVREDAVGGHEAAKLGQWRQLDPGRLCECAARRRHANDGERGTGRQHLPPRAARGGRR